MKITKEQLRGWSAYHSRHEWFLQRFPSGEAEYQDVLNALAEDDRPDDAGWLMDHAGPDRDVVLEVEAISGCKHFFAAGSLIVKNGVAVTGQLRAGRSIKAGESIKAGWSIVVGWGIEAGEDIEAGKGFGIFAGVYLKLAEWPIHARVISKTKPGNLISGSWIERSTS